MRSIYEIIKDLDSSLSELADIGCMTDEEIEEWENNMCDYYIWEKDNKEE